MGDHLLRGKRVTDSEVQAWANEAEEGYDLTRLPRPSRGRPAIGNGPGEATTVRLDAETLTALMRRAEAEGITSRSEAIRAAVREWAHVA